MPEALAQSAPGDRERSAQFVGRTDVSIRLSERDEARSALSQPVYRRTGAIGVHAQGREDAGDRGCVANQARPVANDHRKLKYSSSKPVFHISKLVSQMEKPVECF